MFLVGRKDERRDKTKSRKQDAKKNVPEQRIAQVCVEENAKQFDFLIQ